MLKKPDFGRFISVVRKGNIAERRALAIQWFGASAFLYAIASLVALWTVHPLVSLLLGCGSLLYGFLALFEYVLLRKAGKSAV